MSYAYLVVHTNRGLLRSSVNPSEVFTDEAIQRAVDGIRDAGASVDGYMVREVPEGQQRSDNVVDLITRKPF